MSDSLAGAAAWLGGIEIVNDSRTTAYMKNGIKPSTLTVGGDCGCPNVLTLAGCDTGYNTPAVDNAPWYDSTIPESAEFAGFLSTNFEGLSSTYTRSVTESIADGATLGRSRFGSRTMTWKGWLFGSSCCGVAYGLRWLGKTLQGSNNCGNNCFGEDLELLVCCPTIEAAQGLSSNLICNSDFKNDTGYWASSGNTAITWTSYPFYSDAGALKVVNPVGGALTFNTNCLMSVTAGKKYKLSFYVQTETGVIGQAIGASFNWFDSLGASLGSTVVANLGTDSSSWTNLTTTVQAPVGAVRVQINFTVGDVTTLANKIRYFDDVSFNQTNFAPVVDPFRTIKSVSLLEGPIVTSERKLGNSCGGACGGSTAVEIEFSLVGSQPWLYSAPIPIANCVNASDNSIPIIGSTLVGNLSAGITDVQTTGVTSADFAFLPVVDFGEGLYITLDPNSEFGTPEVVLVTSHTLSSTSINILRAQQGTSNRAHPINTFWSVQTDCSPINCGAALNGVGGCSVPELPPTSTYVGCPIPDINDWQAVYITAPRTMWNSISEVVPVITIQTGAAAVVGARLGFYTSSDGNPCGDLINNPPKCDLICDTLSIKYIPANSKFYIDGRTRKVSLVCGTNAVFAGEPYTIGPFSWPSFNCYGFCMEFAYDSTFVSDGLCVSLSLVPRTTL